jgi:hypothetical protein
MKGMRILKKNQGGYLESLQKSNPNLYKTISDYRTRLSGLEGGADLTKEFDTRGNIQLAATRNMPALEREAYIKSIEKEYANATDEQFEGLVKDLKSEKRFVPTYRYAADTESYGPTTGYYRNLSDEIAQKQKDIDALKVTESKTRMVPQYEMTYARPMYGPAKPSKIVSELPKGAVKTTGNYGQQYYQVPSSDPFLRPQDAGPKYRQVGSKKVTDTFERQARAGDPAYDKAMSELGRLETRHKYRNLYGQPVTSGMTGSNVYTSLGMDKQAAANPYAKLAAPRRLNKGGEIKGKGKAIRGFKFGGVK